jgi:hypothetical protein
MWALEYCIGLLVLFLLCYLLARLIEKTFRVDSGSGPVYGKSIHG